MSGGARYSAPSDEVEAILQQAFARAEDAEWDDAAELLRGGLADHPDDPYLLCWLGIAERELGMEGVAYERFKRALAREPSDPALVAVAGNALAAFDDPEAEAALRIAAMTAPEFARGRWMYGAYLAREGMLEEALVELNAAVELAPDEPVVHLERGVAHALAQDHESAAFAFASAAELDREDGWSRILLGLVQFELGDTGDAAGTLEEGARLRPEDLDAQLLSAMTLQATGWEDRAFEMLERARLQAGAGDQALILETEERMEEGAQACLRLLKGTLVPSSLRERLVQRP